MVSSYLYCMAGDSTKATIISIDASNNSKPRCFVNFDQNAIDQLQNEVPTEIYVALISGIAIICAAVLPAVLIERARKENV